MWIAVLIFTIIICVYSYLDTRKPKNFPPGPAWLPIIGSALQVKKYRQKIDSIFLSLTQIAKDYSGDEIVGIKVGSTVVVVATSLEGYKQICTNDVFNARPTGVLYTSKSWGLRRGIVLTDGEFWQKQRQFLIQYTREFGLGKSRDETISNREVASLIEHLKTEIKNSTCGFATVEMHRIFNIPVMNKIMTFLAGVRYELDDDKIRLFQYELTDYFNSYIILEGLFHYFPFLRYIAPKSSGYTKFMHMNNKLNQFMQEHVDHHKATYKPEVTRDFIDAYIKELRSRGQDGSSFSEKQLIATCFDLFKAGIDSSSKALSYAFLYFVRQPEVVKRAQEEMDCVVGREGMPTWTDRASFPYIEACVYETLRIYSGLGLTVPRRALKDTTLLGYFIPKNTTVSAIPFGVLMNEHFYKDPWIFKPERFISDEDGKIKVPNTDFFPFGLGHRRCFGDNSAKVTLFTFISNILHTFDVRNAAGKPLPEPIPGDPFLPSTQPFEAEISLRHT